MTWDGNRGIGPVALGMTDRDVMAALPGVGTYFDGFTHSPEPFDDADFSWWSDECRLNVGFSEGIVVDIAAHEEFILDGENLIGLSAEAAIDLAGGEVSREGEVMDFVATASGIVLWIMEGVVAQAHLEDYSAIPD